MSVPTSGQSASMTTSRCRLSRGEIASSLTNAELSRRDQCVDATAWPSTRTSNPPSTEIATSAIRAPLGAAGILTIRSPTAGVSGRRPSGRRIPQHGVELPGAQRDVGRLDPDLVLNGVAARVEVMHRVLQTDL